MTLEKLLMPINVNCIKSPRFFRSMVITVNHSTKCFEQDEENFKSGFFLGRDKVGMVSRSLPICLTTVCYKFTMQHPKINLLQCSLCSRWSFPLSQDSTEVYMPSSSDEGRDGVSASIYVRID